MEISQYLLEILEQKIAILWLFSVFFCHTNLEDKATFIEYSKLFRSQRRLLSHQAIYIFPEAKFKKFEPRFKFKPLLKYGWFHLNLCQFFSRYKRAVN